MNAIPFINVLAPGITAGFANQYEEEKRQELLDLMQGQSELNLRQYKEGQGPQVGYVGDYNPALYGAPEDIQFQQAGDSAEGRAAQLAALQQLAAATDQSATSQGALARDQALRDANQFSNSREQAIRMDAARRGQAGGLAETTLRAQAAQAGAERNQQGQLMAAQQAALAQMAGLGQQAQAAAGLRGQDQNINFKNADIINAFNTLNTQERNRINNANTDLGNQAGLRNLETKQGLAGTNTGIQLGMIDRNDRAAMANNEAEMRRRQMIGAAIAGQANQGVTANQAAQEAGKTGMDNFKSVFSMMGGGAAGGIGG
jgi:hypothetical protein